MTLRKTPAGFTLLELMIVVAIIGILAGIAAPNISKLQARAKVAEAKANLKGLYTAQRSYYLDHESYGCGFQGALVNCGGVAFAPERGNRYALTLAAAPPPGNCETRPHCLRPPPEP